MIFFSAWCSIFAPIAFIGDVYKRQDSRLTHIIKIFNTQPVYLPCTDLHKCCLLYTSKRIWTSVWRLSKKKGTTMASVHWTIPPYLPSLLIKPGILIRTCLLYTSERPFIKARMADDGRRVHILEPARLAGKRNEASPTGDVYKRQRYADKERGYRSLVQNLYRQQR